MKANLVSTRVVKATLALAATVVLFISNPLTSQARTIKDMTTPTALSESQISVIYLGSNDNGLLFSVNFENPTGEKFWLILKDDAGDIIFRQQFNDVHFCRSLQLEKGDTEIQHPTFIIRKGNIESVHSFAVSLATTERITVTKL
jgi:hypothetical protein